MSIQELFHEGTNAASGQLKMAEWCSSISLPFVMPPEGFQPGNSLRTPNNSLAARGVANVVGKLRATLFPGDGWFVLDVEPESKYKLDPAEYQATAQQLYIEGVKIQAAIESSHVKAKRRIVPGFYSQTDISLTQLIVTGSTLEGIGLRGNNDFSKRVFGRHQYRTERDSYGEIVHHVIKECVRPDRLPDEIRNAAKVDDKAKTVDVYTLYKRQSDDSWVFTQEINGVEVYEVEHETARIFQTDFKRAGNDHYGRSIIELHGGDFLSNEFFAGRMKDWAFAASKFNPAIGVGSNLHPDDLAKPSGEAIIGARVENGVVQDVGMIRMDKMADFSVAAQVWNETKADLSKTMLLDADSAPKGEAGRHSTAWKQTAEQLQGWLGSFYTTIHDEQQKPLLWAAIDMGIKSGLLSADKLKYADVVSTTGLAAIESKRRAEGALQIAQIAGSFGPEAAKVIDVGVLLNVAARSIGVSEPGLIKSAKQLEQEARRQLADQTRAQAALAVTQEAARAAGGIAQQAAAPA